MNTLNGQGREGSVQQLIIQLSAAEDRGPQEEAVAGEGFIPLVVFANGPENAFLVRTTADVLDAALVAAQDRLDEPGGARLTFRRSLYEGMRQSIEADFAEPGALDSFPDLALQLFAEALAQQGIDRTQEVPPCAVRFAADNLDEPDYEEAAETEEG
jgi:hypothetical protein